MQDRRPGEQGSIFDLPAATDDPNAPRDCPSCKGDGINSKGELCGNCEGTGRAVIPF